MSKHVQDNFSFSTHLPAKTEQCTKQSNQLSQLPTGSVAAQATNYTYQHSCTPHQVKTHHHHIFFHHEEVAPRETVNFFLFPCHLSPAPSAQSTRTLRASLSL